MGSFYRGSIVKRDENKTPTGNQFYENLMPNSPRNEYTSYLVEELM